MPFYKRAQITCADLALAFGGRGLGAFRDLGELTLFADNLVPHVLRMKGVLALRARARRAHRRARSCSSAGGPEEVEIRAVALHAVGALAARLLRGAGSRPPARPGPAALGARPGAGDQGRPRHRARCTYY